MFFSEEELHALSEKKQHLLENLKSKEKELQEAETLEISQPGTVIGMYIVFSTLSLFINKNCVSDVLHCVFLL